MRIAYLIFNNLKASSGVAQKLSRQMREWEQTGSDVRLFCLCKGAFNPEIQFPHISAFPFQNALQRNRALNKAFGEIRQWCPDILYARMGPFYPNYWNGFKIAPTILEVNTDDSVEYNLTKALGPAFYHKLTRRFMLSAAAGFVFLTRELMSRLKPPQKPGIVISNGIENLSTATLSPGNPNPRLFFIGTAGYSWHGVDKIVGLAKLFPDWHFELVGCSKDEFEGLLPGNVTFHGQLVPQEYLSVASACDVAIGTLALHRKGMDEACPLKVREYLALGLPTIIGYKDTDDLSKFPFVLEIPNTETSISESKAKIANFVRQWRGQRFAVNELKPLLYSEKERERLRFFQSFN